MVFTNLGLKFTLATVPHLFGVSVSQEKAQGSFYQGFDIQGIRIESKDYVLSSNKMQWIWEKDPNKKKKGLVEVKLIELGDLFYLKIPNDKVKPPAKLPKSLQLPIDLKIHEIHISSLSVEGSESPIISNGRFNLSYVNHLYTFEIEELIIFSSLNRGSIFLKDKAPFELAGQVDSYSLHSSDTHYGFIKLSDSLQYPLLETNIQNKGLDIIGYIHLSPFDPIATRRIISANIVGDRINPKNFVSSWLDAELSFELSTGLKKENPEVFYGNFNIQNARPAYYEQKGIPIKEISLDFEIPEDGTLRLSRGVLETMTDGKIDATGAMYPDGTIRMLANVNLGLIDFMQTPIKNTYQGQATLEGTYINPILKINIESPWNQLQVDAQFRSKDKILLFNQFVLSKTDSYFEGAGKFYLKDRFDVDLDLFGKNFNPNIINPSYPKGSINGEAYIRGNINESLQLMTDIDNSQISNMPFYMKGVANFNTKGVNEADIKLKLGYNHLILNGKANNDNDKLNIDVSMPNLQYFGFGISGNAFIKGYIQGSFKNLIANLAGKLNKVKLPGMLALDFLDFDINISPDLSAPLKVDIKGNGLNFKDFYVNNINSLFTGTLASHSGSSQFSLKLPNQEVLTGRYRARGGVNEDYVWIGKVDELNLSGFINLLLQNPVPVTASVESLKVGDAKWTVLGGLMHLNYFDWAKGKGFKTKGDVTGVQLGQLKNFVDLPFEQNIVVRGDWDLTYNANASGYIKLTKQAGDILFSERKTPLGLDKFDFSAQLYSNRIKALLDTQTRFANGRLDMTISQKFGKNFKTSPIQGQINVNSSDIGTFKYTLPVGMDLKGKIDSKINISGTVGDPKLNGYFNGTNIEYRDLSNGISLRNGKLESRLVGKQWIIDQLSFKNKEGTILLKGVVGEINRRYGVDLELNLDHYLVTNQPNRQFVISGQTKINLDETSGLKLTGNLQLDRGKYENLGDSMPQLSDDVHIVGEKKSEPNNSIPFMVDLGLDLNDQLRFILSDLNFLVGGKLRLRAQKGRPLRIFGKIVAVEGKYRAYGQNLRVEKGSLVFTGIPGNAQMNIRARRYQSPVGAGVDVTGTFQDPRVTLISDVPMSDRDKLSWLILGRESKGEDDNDALALAVGVLAAERVNKEAGSVFDNIGLSSNRSRNPNTGELNPAEQIVTFGKQLNENLYMGYEFGVQSSTQAVRLIYIISQSLKVFGRVGTESAGGGVKYKRRFD
ncbi:MAG: translocation/assembly module TamB domain-containing protein [Neisseriaceae bacterium]|nr:translocation/assembly module TamB domain-containing protein [Neisseriaceae bacterium]